MERMKLTSTSAKTQVDIWSTDAAGARERYSYWREAVCRAVFNISIEALPEPFSARITSRSCGPLRFSTSESTGYELIRSRRDIANAPSDHYTIFLQLSGGRSQSKATRRWRFMVATSWFSMGASRSAPCSPTQPAGRPRWCRER